MASDPFARLRAAEALLAAGESDQALAAYESIIRELQAARDIASRDAALRALLSKATVLSNLDRLDDALAAYDLVPRRYGDDTDPACVELVVDASRWRPVLRALERDDEALRAYDDLVTLLGTPDGETARATAAAARLDKGDCLAELGRLDDARAGFASLADVAPDLTSDLLVAMALYAGSREADMLEQLEKHDDALARRRVVLERFSGARGEAALAQTASMLERYAIGLVTADRVDEAIAAHERLLALHPTSPAPAARERAVRSAVERACLLFTRGDTAAGAEALRSVFARFSTDTDDEVSRLCAFAGVRGCTSSESRPQGGGDRARAGDPRALRRHGRCGHPRQRELHHHRVPTGWPVDEARRPATREARSRGWMIASRRPTRSGISATSRARSTPTTPSSALSGTAGRSMRRKRSRRP